MNPLSRRLPSLGSLLAFDAVLRNGTITAAAVELGTTQPAISQRIKALEGMLGVRLFRRAGRNLQPTAAAWRYGEEVATALSAIAQATDGLKAPDHQERPIVISAPFGFSHLWLAPILPRLEEAFPSLNIIVRAEDGPKFKPQRKPDLEICFGASSGLSHGAYFLMHEIVQPVCSPEFVQSHDIGDDGLTAQEMERLPLLHLDDEDPRWCNWPRWFAANGVRGFRASPRLYYNNYPLLEQAAAEGKGVALGWHGLVDPMLAAGRLVAIGNLFFRREWGYSLHIGNPSDPNVRNVAGWIRDDTQPLAKALLEKFGLETTVDSN